MKITGTIFLLLFTTYTSFCQNQPKFEQINRKGDFYFYWGWNRGWYSNSDIKFSGENYNFSLKEVVAKDRQSKFEPAIYFVPTQASIPQYNFRVGYFITNNYNISVGLDHMKYVVTQDQAVKISGNISISGTVYDGVYDNDEIIITDDFLQFEHTDGLNYANFEIRRFDEIFDLDKIKIGLTEGVGAGLLIPRTNTTLLNNEMYDEFHLAGYGINGVVGINISFFKFLFVQSELKGGFINMPDIRTTISESDNASQCFFFSQLNIVFGATINF